jgi:predicted nucleotidyltransferase
MSETVFHDILSVLKRGNVEFILIGGLAGMAMGSARATVDVDVVYRRTEENIQRLSDCLQPHEPYLRGAPAGLPFCFDAATVSQGLNFTLTTSLGDVDLLGEVIGGGDYEQLLEFTEPIQLFGIEMNCVTLEKLIQLKRAAGRPKDLEAIAELEVLLEERANNDTR